jgi:hypothetical protein
MITEVEPSSVMHGGSTDLQAVLQNDTSSLQAASPSASQPVIR